LARSAQAGQTWARGVAARDEDLAHLAGIQVGTAQLHRADARAVLDGQVADDLAGQRHGQPLDPSGLDGRFGHRSPPIGWSLVQMSA